MWGDVKMPTAMSGWLPDWGGPFATPWRELATKAVIRRPWRDSWKRPRMKVIGGDTGDALRSRVCAEFIEMPGLQLTFEQATRLWGIEPIVCRRVIDELVACGFLKRTPSGRVMRADRH